LDAICRKALSANKEDRYLTALELANDLEHWLADEPIEALPDNRRQRAGRWMRKHRGPAQWIITTILLSVVSLAIVVTTRVVQSRELVQQRVEFLKTQGNFKEILIQSAFEDLLNDVRRLAGREDVRQAALAFNSLPLPAPADDRSGILDLERDIELFFREVLAQNPDYMQVRYLANDASGSEKIRIDRSRRDGPSHLKDKAELQGKRGSDYFDHTIALEQGKPGKEPVYLSDIDINRENGKRQWNFPVVRAAAPVFSQPENGKCLGIVVINMHFGHVLDKMEQAATQDVQVYLTDQKGNFLGFPDNGNRLGFHEHHDVAFCSDRGLEFSLKMLFKDLGSFISLPNDDVSILQATPNRTLFVSGRRNGPTQELQQALNQSILGGRYGNLEVEFTKYDPADAFDPETPDARANDARPMAVLEGDNWSPENITEQIAGELGHQYDLKVLPELTPSTDHALYCRKIFLSALTADGPDQADNRKRFLCLLLVLPHSASLETGVTGNRD
ncbi:MAG: hypothetical protein VB858_14160, partial [Planctomycetaceae bacterium]